MPLHHGLQFRRLQIITCAQLSPAAKRFFCLFYQWTQSGSEPLRKVAKFELTPDYGRPLPQFIHCSNKLTFWRRPRFQSFQGSKCDVQYRSLSTSCPPGIANPVVSSFSPTKRLPRGLDSDDASPLSHNVRLMMRHVPHSVVVITSALPPAEPAYSQCSSYRGMTVSSFTTVALSPAPTVCFNIRAPSSTLTAIQNSGYFLAHILDATPLGAEIADVFSRGLGATAFDSQSFKVIKGGDGMPSLVSPGVRGVLQCRSLGEGVVVGDHVIVLGEITGIQGEVREDESEKGYGLVYVNRAYRCIGKDIPIDGG